MMRSLIVLLMLPRLSSLRHSSSKYLLRNKPNDFIDAEIITQDRRFGTSKRSSSSESTLFNGLLSPLKAVYNGIVKVFNGGKESNEGRKLERKQQRRNDMNTAIDKAFLGKYSALPLTSSSSSSSSFSP